MILTQQNSNSLSTTLFTMKQQDWILLRHFDSYAAVLLKFLDARIYTRIALATDQITLTRNEIETRLVQRG